MHTLFHLVVELQNNTNISNASFKGYLLGEKENFLDLLRADNHGSSNVVPATVVVFHLP